VSSKFELWGRGRKTAVVGHAVRRTVATGQRRGLGAGVSGSGWEFATKGLIGGADRHPPVQGVGTIEGLEGLG